MSIYVETFIRAPLEELWQRTQTPEQHARWDLRFSDIEYLPRPDTNQPQRFLYITRIGFGLRICGEGESVTRNADAPNEADSSVRTSVLKFWSNDAKSLIREGAGYWKYAPEARNPQAEKTQAEGVRFWTQYDYSTRFGWPGRVFDALIFKPLMGWATAWSFDCLRLWLEKDIAPETSQSRALTYAVARVSLALIWIYQGLVPKLLCPDSGELAILKGAAFFAARPDAALRVLEVAGVAEIVFGLLFLFCWRARTLWWVNIAALCVLACGALFSRAVVFIEPFNPATLSVAMIALSCCGLLADHDLPSAKNCRRSRKKTRERNP